jgi:ABC-type nickel/cobalt efflux system permease component RcnA
MIFKNSVFSLQKTGRLAWALGLQRSQKKRSAEPFSYFLFLQNEILKLPYTILVLQNISFTLSFLLTQCKYRRLLLHLITISDTHTHTHTHTHIHTHTHTHTHTHILGRSLLDKGCACRRSLSTWQHTALKRDRHTCSRRDSNTQSQRGRIPTP